MRTRRTHRGSGGREGQLLVHNVIPSERDDKEYTKEAGTNCQSDQYTEITLGELRQQVQAIHGWDGPDEEDA